MVWGRSMTLFFSCKLRPSGTCQGYRESGVAPGTQPGAPLGQAAPPPNQDSQGPQPGFLGRLEAKCLRRGEGGPALTGFHPWGGRWEIRLQSHLQMQLEEGARPPAVCVAGLIVGGGQPPGQPCCTGPQINDSPIHEAHGGALKGPGCFQ